MRIAVIGKDKRFDCLSQLLRQHGHDVTAETSGAELVVVQWPSAVSIEGAGHVVTCGPQPAPEGMIDLLNDEVYQRDIAWMTAEGAVVAAASASDRAIRGSDCLVIGWGRIGRALTNALRALDARVTVLSRREEAQVEIVACGARAANTFDAGAHMRGSRFIFSTPPAMVLDYDALAHADKSAIVIDLASPPYGVDLEAAEQLGVRAWREPGIPGRYCPVNAALAIYKAMRRCVGGGIEHG